MRKKKVAWLSPFPPQRSGVANYSYWLVKALQPYFDIDLYYDNDEPPAELRNDFNTYELGYLPELSGDYDEVVYHLGNHSSFHKRIYELAWHFPATIVLHDYNLSGFVHEAFYRDNAELYEQTLLEGYGDEARNALQTLSSGQMPDGMKFPMSHAIVARSKRVIVHHRWVKNQFQRNEHIEVIPHFARLNYRPTRNDVETFKGKLGLKSNHFVLTCLGFINRNKLPRLQIDVVRRLLDGGYPVQMLFAGAPAKDVENLALEVAAGTNNENIIFTGYLDEPDYFNAIFASDIILNLRNPSMGEASGTLMHALGAAKPTIVSNNNQYKEFPDKVCWKLTHDENEAELLYEYLRAMLCDKNLREVISANSSEYINSVFGWDAIIARWVEII